MEKSKLCRFEDGKLLKCPSGGEKKKKTYVTMDASLN
jgi:hypothetical protein